MSAPDHSVFANAQMVKTMRRAGNVVMKANPASRITITTEPRINDAHRPQRSATVGTSSSVIPIRNAVSAAPTWVSEKPRSTSK